jgi:hypothetical protein
MAATALFPGYSEPVQPFIGPSPDVVGFNKNNQNLKVYNYHRPINRDTALTKTVTIPSGEAAKYPDVFASSGSYTITVKRRCLVTPPLPEYGR